MAIINNLISYWKLDEDSGDAIDIHSTNNGIVVGATPNVEGKINTAYDFNGTTNVINVNGLNTQFNTDFTISMWAYNDNDGGDIYQVAGESYNMIRIVAGDPAVVYCYINGNHYTNSGAIINKNTWYHFLVTYEGSTLKLYINNNYIGSVNHAGGFHTDSEDYFEIGKSFSGKIDEVGVWSRAITESERGEIYNSGDSYNGFLIPPVLPYEYEPVYTKLDIGGTTYADVPKITVDRTIGEFNATSNFTAEFNNFNGKYSDTFNLNDEVIIYADRGVDPTTNIFKGIIEDINFRGDTGSEKIKIIGRDYGAILQDMTVQPIIYKNTDAGVIAKQVLLNNTEELLTGNNINTSTGTTIERIGFNQVNVFSALQELAELAGCYFYVDTDKDVHFEVKSSTASDETFDNTNVYNATFKKDDKEIYNKIWVYGSRVLTGANDTGGIGAGSVFQLNSKPHNTRVFVSDVLQQPGGIYELTNPATESGLKYVVDFNEKDIIFVSGTEAGDNVPTSGTSNVSVDYERYTPLLKYLADDTSIADYGPKTKIIKDENLKSFPEVNEKATAFLADNKDPKIQGDLDIKGIIDLTPGNTCVVDLPWHGINSQTYTILSVSYSFNKLSNRADKVLHVTVNKKLSDFTDVMKDQMIKLRRFEVGPLEGEYTNLKTVINSADVNSHYELWAKDINSNFVFHSSKHGRLNDPNSRIGTGELGSTFIVSGGGF